MSRWGYMKKCNMKRVLINIYRRVQYAFCGRSLTGVLSPGGQVTVAPFRIDENFGDIVHPCVRFFSEGYEGHKWWMVYTPYYGADSSKENPILCYSDVQDPNLPPTEWKVYGLVNEKPTDGYNSDPTLLYFDGQLYVYWRENYEWNKAYHKYIRVTYMAKVSDGIFERVGGEILYTTDKEIDAETCPTFMLNEDGSVTAYAMHLRFHSDLIQGLRPMMKIIATKIVSITDLLGLYSQQKHYGIAIWKQKNSFSDTFEYVKTVKFKNCNKLYRPWHMDFFDWQGVRYAVVQTNQCNADIALAYSNDGEHFTFYKKPLITNATIGKVGIYKLCAGVTPDGMFYLYYTAQDIQNRALNKLYVTTLSMQQLLMKL